MFVGRTICGLPIDKPEFGILPPSFEGANPGIVNNAIRLVFPTMPKCLYRSGDFCLASLVYHSGYLLDNLPSTHPVFQSVVFRSSTLLDELKPLVKCTLAHEGSTVKGTGIPPHISMLTQLKQMKDALEQNLQQQNENVLQIIDGIMKKLEEKAVGLNQVTQDCLKDTLMKCLEEAGVMRIVQNIKEPTTGTANATAQQTRQIWPLHLWGGQHHRFPEDFLFPKCSVLDAWRLWCVGTDKHPPLRSLTPQELSTSNKQKRLSDMKWLMLKIEDNAKQLGITLPCQSEEEAISLFERCCSAVELPKTTKTGLKCRRGQVTWLSAVDILRNENERVRVCLEV
jgi:hypothetical protein